MHKKTSCILTKCIFLFVFTGRKEQINLKSPGLLVLLIFLPVEESLKTSPILWRSQSWTIPKSFRDFNPIYAFARASMSWMVKTYTGSSDVALWIKMLRAALASYWMPVAVPIAPPFTASFLLMKLGKKQRMAKMLEPLHQDERLR